MPYVHINDDEIADNLDCVDTQTLLDELEERRKRGNSDAVAPGQPPGSNEQIELLRRCATELQRRGIVLGDPIFRERVHLACGVML